MPAAKFEIQQKCKICDEYFIVKTLESWYCTSKCSKIAYKRLKNEELFQVNKCFVSLVVHGIVVPSLPVKIERTGKKEQLTQHDLANLSWNIANQYNIPNKLAAQFAQYTFPAWFWNTTTETLAKKLKHRSGDLYIKIDENIIDDKKDL